jgi:hypothetical protein
MRPQIKNKSSKHTTIKAKEKRKRKKENQIKHFR